LLGPSSQLPAVDRFDLPFACSTEELAIFGVGLDDLLGVVIEGLFDEAKTAFIGVSGFFELTSDEIVDAVSIGENSMDWIESSVEIKTVGNELIFKRGFLGSAVCLCLYLRTITLLTLVLVNP
jgi:hypothetical protein